MNASDLAQDGWGRAVLGLLLCLLASPIAHARGSGGCGDRRATIVARGYVRSNSLGTGPLAAVQVDQPATFTFHVIVPGQVVNPGLMERYSILAPSGIQIGGLGGPFYEQASLSMVNNWNIDSLRWSGGVVGLPGYFIRFNADDGSKKVFTSPDLEDHAGVYERNQFTAFLVRIEDQQGTLSVWLTGLKIDVPWLSSRVSSISLATGGSQPLALDVGPEYAGSSYWLLGSLAGTSPGTYLGNTPVPLNPDAYFAGSLLNSSYGLLPGGRGHLDESGRACLEATVPAGLAPALSGLQVNHAVVWGASLDRLSGASNSVPLLLRP